MSKEVWPPGASFGLLPSKGGKERKEGRLTGSWSTMRTSELNVQSSVTAGIGRMG